MVPSKIKIESFAKRYHMGTLGGKGLRGSVDSFLCLTVSNVFPSDDLVYLENDPERDEYVINEKGKLYVGQFRKARGRPWAFGQFDDVVLPVACYILELGKLAHSERGNPVQVVRAISAGVSACEKVKKPFGL